MLSLDKDLQEPYGGFYWGWQILGFLLPIAGLLALIIPAFVCTKELEPLKIHRVVPEIVIQGGDRGGDEIELEENGSDIQE
jgi:hypothetical protein